MPVTKAMRDAFQAGFTDPGAPLTPGEERLLRHRVGPRIVFMDDVVEENPSVIHVGELRHQPYDGDEDIIDEDIIDAEIVED
jgi:hypothetical protein